MSIFIGIDPGLKESHAVVLQGAAPGERPTVLATLTLQTPTGPERYVLPGAWVLDDLLGAPADALLIEVARGGVAAGRDGDHVLNANIVAGELLGRLNAAGRPALPVASGGDAAGWNWRDTLGIKGKGAAARDASIVQAVDVYLGPGALPRGPKGGLIMHWYDAAGIALAGFIRASERPRTAVHAALTSHTARDVLTLEGRKSRKTARAAGRKGEWVWL